MRRIYLLGLITGILIFLLCACCPCEYSSGRSSGSNPPTGSAALAPCIIYKTKADYSKNVPVTVSDDKSKILSYPDRRDVFYQDHLAYPTELDKGFYLDNRGIGPNVAFLGYTYAEYAALDQTPSAGDLFARIIDKDPLIEMYQCGKRADYHDIVPELNRKIRKGDFGDFKKIK
jgi:hypothetical protein